MNERTENALKNPWNWIKIDLLYLIPFEYLAFFHSISNQLATDSHIYNIYWYELLFIIHHVHERERKEKCFKICKEIHLPQPRALLLFLFQEHTQKISQFSSVLLNCITPNPLLCRYNFIFFNFSLSQLTATTKGIIIMKMNEWNDDYFLLIILILTYISWI